MPTEALNQELAERYDAYRALRDGESDAYDPIAGGSPDLPEPNALPEEMAAFLQAHEYGCLLWATDQGSVFVAKAPRADIESLRGRVPVHLRHELYDHPKAPVIRTVVTWYDKPDAPLALESYTNIGDEQQRQDFLDLAQRQELRFLFYDEALRHRLTKAVLNNQAETIGQLAAAAERLRATIPDEQFNFDAAKASLMERTSL